MRLDHPIFHAPLEPTLELHELEPAKHGYRGWLEGRELPATIPAWQIQSGILGREIDYGEVSSPYGFEDSPDCEWISSGVNSKGPTSLALGRQGNWFLWGFAGDPRLMTEGGRQVFLNVLVWMRQFDGKGPLLALQSSGPLLTSARESVLVEIGLYGEYLGKSTSAAAVRNDIPWSVLAACGDDVAKMFEHYRARIEYVRPFPHRYTSGGFEMEGVRLDVDPLLEELGVSNRRLEFFDALLNRMRQCGAADATVKDLCDRYLPPDAPREASALAAWVAEHRDRLFFSDVYGYRWFVAPQDLPKRAGWPSAANGSRASAR